MCPVYYSDKHRTGWSGYKLEYRLFRFIHAGTDVLDKYVNASMSDDKGDLLCVHPSIWSQDLVFVHDLRYSSEPFFLSPSRKPLTVRAGVMSKIYSPRNFGFLPVPT
jgi:hypothetical protein